MDKHIMIKRIWSLFLAIVLIMGTVTVSAPKMAKAADNEITVAYSSRWDDGTGAYVWEFDIDNLPGDAPATVYYRLETMTVDGTERTNQVWVEVQNTGRAFIRASNWDCDHPKSSLLIKKGAILRKANQENPWVPDPNGETLKISNDVYVTSTDGGTTWKVENPVVANDVALRFVVVSDAHMETADDARGKRIAQMFEQAYAYAKQDKTHPTLDAVVFNGDIVNHGTAAEYDAFKEVIDGAIHAGETELLTTMGNHEYWDQNVNGAGVDSAQLYKVGISDIASVKQKELNWSTTINGYSFIGMSPQVGVGKWDTYGETTLDWMSSAVETAIATDSTKPVFTFQHFAIGDTVYGTKGGTGAPTGESDALNAVYDGHNQIINFSGHTHAPINEPTSINHTS